MTPIATSNGAARGVAEGRPRILIPEKVSPDGMAMLEPHFDVDVKLGMTPEELISQIPGYHGLIVRSETKVTEEVLLAGRKLRVVARAGVGVDNINVPAATSRGIIVVNSPSGNILAAAEHTIALLLATARHIGRADGSLKQGGWERSKLVGIEVGRKVLGIVGLGKVGMNVARMAKGLGMQVIAVDPYANPDMARQAGVDLASNLKEILPVVDFLTIHTPLLATTLDLVGEEEFKLMKKTARVLNVARGGVYNEAALVKALDEGWIAGAGIDVFTSEPPKPDSAAGQITKHPKVVATPHLGASTVEAQENVSIDVCTQVLEILRGGLPTSAVNAPIILPEEYRKLQPFVQLIEKMGRLYTQHFVRTKGGLVGGRNFELIYHGDLAGMSNTKPLYAALVKGLVASFSDSHVNIVNAALIAKEKGIKISETHSHQPGEQTYANLVTLRAAHAEDGSGEQIIEGYASGKRLYISKLDRFNATFTPEGTMIFLHNYDEPGKIGGVGMVLGSHGINIRFMQVASLDEDSKQAEADACALQHMLPYCRAWGRFWRRNQASRHWRTVHWIPPRPLTFQRPTGLERPKASRELRCVWLELRTWTFPAGQNQNFLIHSQNLARLRKGFGTPPEASTSALTDELFFSFSLFHFFYFSVIDSFGFSTSSSRFWRHRTLRQFARDRQQPPRYRRSTHSSLDPSYPKINPAMPRRGAPGGLASFRPAVLGLGRVLGLCLTASAAPVSSLAAPDHHDTNTPVWVLAVSSMTLVLLGGAFAGLTIALMGQDSIYLQVLSGDPNEPQHKNAKRVLTLLNRGKHWVLVTLLLANVIVNESLPVVLDRFLGGGVAAVVGSTILIVIFGEIVPQSVCVRYGLPIGGYMSTPVLILMYLLGPVAWPTAKLLDWILGEDHGTLYKKSGLKTLVTLHKSLGEVSERLNQDEVTIITAVLDLKDKPISEVMTPMDDVFTLAEDHVLDEATMDTILSSGYSRIPIYRAGKPTDFVGMLLVKTLITYDPEDRILVRDVQLGAVVETRPETSCLDIINFFQEGKSHMVLVSEFPGSNHGALGVVTLEDVIEELIGEEIVDESDVYVDVHKAIRRLTPAPRAHRRHSDVPGAGVAVRKTPDHASNHNHKHVEGQDVEVGSYKSDSGHLERPPKTAVFMKRQHSAGPDGRIGKNPVPVKASLDEMRQQLKLGPANRAANPLSSTRGSVFKIKQGLGTTVVTTTTPDAKVTGVDTESTEEHNENTPLLGKGQNGASERR
ncbi:Protein MAM3 [Trichoderma lentiforme]|uniref:D-3-phosphoglycerate dehydrogenase n=1 Tax=Trichoderma lentiforme TaxID=1567552 RepID=A0A9P4XFT0_9HYPO|nr:Protein MAM3 [Trichoderma lentiforme]